MRRHWNKRLIIVMCLLLTQFSCNTQRNGKDSHARLPISNFDFFTQVSSHLEDFNGQPLICSNASGYYRPYALENGKLESIIAPKYESQLKGWDLYRPYMLSSDEIIMSGSYEGSYKFDIFVYNTKTKNLVNITNTPDANEGDLCVDTFSKNKFISFKKDDRQMFAKVNNDGTLSYVKSDVPGFYRATFVAENELLGVNRIDQNDFTLYVCDINQDSDNVVCRSTAALNNTYSVVGFTNVNNRAGIITLENNETYRTPKVFSKDYSSLRKVSGKFKKGDILNYAGDAYRYDFHSYFRIKINGYKCDYDDYTFYSLRNINNVYYAIVATSRYSRALAKIENGKKPFVYDSYQVDDSNNPREIWLEGENFKVQAFYYGSQTQKRVVIWLHGGPSENVSPRFNPYYYVLNKLGYGVLAINYPGSTGRGSEYEKLFSEESVKEALVAAINYLRKGNVSTIVLWGVSTGAKLLRVALDHEIKVSGIVDQSGFANNDFAPALKKLGIPYFAIRGKYDYNGFDPTIDFEYEGGHDITNVNDFQNMFREINPFLQDLK